MMMKFLNDSALLSPRRSLRTFAPVFLAVVVMALGLQVGARAAWQTLVDGSSFGSPTAFAKLWSYNYPWGDTHNGSALMIPGDISFSGGVATITSTPVSGQGNIHYDSGTFYLKQKVTISAQTPVWDISIQAEVPTVTGTWPAFWLTGANSWPPESDVMEFKGSGTVWQNTYNGTWANQLTPVSSPGAWHTYRLVAVMINATTVDFHYFIDGNLSATHTQTGFVGAPMWVLFDYQMEGSSGAPGPNYVTHTSVRNPIIRCENVTGVPAGPIPNGTYKLVNRNSGLALDTLNYVYTNGVDTDTYGYWGGVNQQWTLTHLGNGVYSILNRFNGRSADVYNNSRSNGTPIDVWDYTSGANQHWTASANGGGYFRFSSVLDGLPMEAYNAGTSNLTSVDQWTWWGGANQQWAPEAP